MVLSKVLSKYQITLPKEVVRSLDIHKGEYLKCAVRGRSISLTPVSIEETYSEEDIRTFHTLYSHPANRGKVYKNKTEALAHLKHLRAER